MAEFSALIVGDAPRDGGRLDQYVPPSFKADVVSLEHAAVNELPAGATGFEVVVFDARGVTDAERDRLREKICSFAGSAPSCAVLVVVDAENGLSEEAAAAGLWVVVRDDDLAVQLPPLLTAAARITVLRRSAELRGASRKQEDSADEEAEPLQMVGTSEAIRSVFGLIRRVASCDVPILLTGESGTGKELAALAIHDKSRRANGPFVAINCGAIPETLLESELFGVERGAYTGATQTRKGRFEAADGGTLLLDEIGDLAPVLQVKLLRFLQDHIIERVGGRTATHVDVRVIAATNRDLHAMVAAGTFREDLYFRLAVLTIDLPPLRDRDEDVVLMARFFLQRYRRDASRPLTGYSREAIDAILRYNWPGNIRELINRVRRAVVVAEGPLITPADLDLAQSHAVEPISSLRDARREAERRCVRLALQRTYGNKMEAARLLGISRTQLYELLARHGSALHSPQWDATSPRD